MLTQALAVFLIEWIGFSMSITCCLNDDDVEKKTTSMNREMNDET